MQEIRATCGDSGVNPRNLDPLPIPPVTSLFHPRQPPLLALEVSQTPFQVARIAGLPAVAIDDHILDAQVQANRIAGGWQGLNLDLARKRHEVAPVRRLLTVTIFGVPSGIRDQRILSAPRLGSLSRKPAA